MDFTPLFNALTKNDFDEAQLLLDTQYSDSVIVTETNPNTGRVHTNTIQSQGLLKDLLYVGQEKALASAIFENINDPDHFVQACIFFDRLLSKAPQLDHFTLRMHALQHLESTPRPRPNHIQHAIKNFNASLDAMLVMMAKQFFVLLPDKTFCWQEVRTAQYMLCMNIDNLLDIMRSHMDHKSEFTQRMFYRKHDATFSDLSMLRQLRRELSLAPEKINDAFVRNLIVAIDSRSSHKQHTYTIERVHDAFQNWFDRLRNSIYKMMDDMWTPSLDQLLILVHQIHGYVQGTEIPNFTLLNFFCMDESSYAQLPQHDEQLTRAQANHLWEGYNYFKKTYAMADFDQLHETDETKQVFSFVYDAEILNRAEKEGYEEKPTFWGIPYVDLKPRWP